MAFHLRRTVTELANEITYSEFLKWLQILEGEEMWRAKQEHYMAQIATEVRRSYVKHPNQVKVSDLMVVVRQMGVEANWEDQMARSKAVYAHALGPNLQRVGRN